MKTLLIIWFLGIITMSTAQVNPNYLQWSSSNKLKLADFEIKKSKSSQGTSFAQFSLDFSVSGLDFLTKNFNKKVRNSIIKSASWIDTTANIDVSLRYQQTLFDMAEIYARKFRKGLKENKKQIAKGLQIVDELNSSVSAEFTKRRLKYDEDTKNGKDIAMQKSWEKQIQRELSELSDYQFEK